jgi:hypothetical protein
MFEEMSRQLDEKASIEIEQRRRSIGLRLDARLRTS